MSNENSHKPDQDTDTGNSKPIDTPEKVPASNDEKIDEDFPGYPHYPAEDDMMQKDNNNGREDVDVENLSRANSIEKTNVQQAGKTTNDPGSFAAPTDSDDTDINISPNDADVTPEDLLLLGSKDQDMDLGEDETISADLEVTGDDLDVPGSELDDANELIGEEDEENNYYSIGGDNHENLEEDNQNG